MSSLLEMQRKESADGFSQLREKNEAYHAGKIPMKEYKPFGASRGVFGQKDHQKNMVRLRQTGGLIDRDHLRFLVSTARKYNVDHLHFATCQSFQMHDLDTDQAIGILSDAADQGIVSFGTGGNYPRNIMCSPLAGVDPDEIFDVMPYALAAGDYLVNRCEDPQMPKKLKTAFCGSEDNITHATYRDLGFTANPDGTFAVWCAGGLGPNPRLGIKVLDSLDGEDILYAVQTMVSVFQKYGMLADASKRRTRYMVEACGGEDAFRRLWLEEFEKQKQNPDLRLQNVQTVEFTKTGDGSTPKDDWRITPQKQEGLYSVLYHPAGGRPKLETLETILHLLETGNDGNPIEEGQLRASPFQNLYIINLTGREADAMLDAIEEDNAKNIFDTSVACVGGLTCEIGLQDSPAAFAACSKRIHEENLPYDCLPQVHFSGCHNSCGAHQTAKIGLSGTFGRKNGKPVPAFSLCLYGNSSLENSEMGRSVGTIALEDLPDFFAALAKKAAAANKSYDEWIAENPSGAEETAKEFLLA